MKPTLQPGIEHVLTFRVTKSKTVPVLYPEAPEFEAMPAGKDQGAGSAAGKSSSTRAPLGS